MEKEEEKCIIEHTDVETIFTQHLLYISAKKEGETYPGNSTNSGSNKASKSYVKFHMLGDNKVTIFLPNGGLREYVNKINSIVESGKKSIVLKELQDDVIKEISKKPKNN